MLCPKCGTQINDPNTIYCPSCGVFLYEDLQKKIENQELKTINSETKKELLNTQGERYSQPNYFKKIIVPLSLFIMFFFGFLGLLIYDGYISAPTFIQSFYDSSLGTMKIKAEIAEEEALKKYPDAYLIMISVYVKTDGVKDFATPLFEQYNNNYQFIFYSPNQEKVLNVMIGIDKNTISKAVEESAPVEIREFSEISLAEARIGYKKALEILDNNGGKEFKENNPNSKQIESMLAKINEDKKSALVWTVGYYKENNNVFILFIDAKDGKVIKKTTEIN